jgi:hypothetical protein
LQDAGNIYVVQELCHGGDLADLMSVSELLPAAMLLRPMQQHSHHSAADQPSGAVLVSCSWHPSQFQAHHSI